LFLNEHCLLFLLLYSRNFILFYLFWTLKMLQFLYKIKSLLKFNFYSLCLIFHTIWIVCHLFKGWFHKILFLRRSYWFIIRRLCNYYWCRILQFRCLLIWIIIRRCILTKNRWFMLGFNNVRRCSRNHWWNNARFTCYFL
jgi:hypothetical protein